MTPQTTTVKRKRKKSTGIIFHGLKPPRIVVQNKELFTNVRSVLDIGAGEGRFIGFFLNNAPYLEKYVAVEADPVLAVRLRMYLNDSRVEIINDYWENVENELLKRRYDVVILWNVIMFLDEDPYQLLERIIDSTKKYILFSIYSVNEEYMPRLNKKILLEIVNYMDNHPRLRIVAKLNSRKGEKFLMQRIYEVI